jgi:hypothetical protein
MEATDTKIGVNGMDLFREVTPREAVSQAAPRPRGVPVTARQVSPPTRGRE